MIGLMLPPSRVLPLTWERCGCFLWHHKGGDHSLERLWVSSVSSCQEKGIKRWASGTLAELSEAPVSFSWKTLATSFWHNAADLHNFFFIHTHPVQLCCLYRQTTLARSPGRLKTSQRRMQKGSDRWSSPRARMSPWQPLVGFPWFCSYFRTSAKQKTRHLKQHSKRSQLVPLQHAFALGPSASHLLKRGRTQPLNRRCLAHWGEPNAISKFLWSQPAKYWHQMLEKKEREGKERSCNDLSFF